MNHTDARQALRELGIRNPSPSLIENYLRAAEAVDGKPDARIGDTEPFLAPEPGAADKLGDHAVAAHSSASKLEPVLRDAGQLERAKGPRKPGRPRIVASWFPKVAEMMADGTSLRMALAMNGINNLSRSEVRACYRNKTLKTLYTEARRRFLVEHYGRKPTLRARIGRYV